MATKFSPRLLSLGRNKSLQKYRRKNFVTLWRLLPCFTQVLTEQVVKSAMMKAPIAFLFLAGGRIREWSPVAVARRSLTSLQMSTDVSSKPYMKPDRVIRNELPIVHVYDHCPFCVRVRLALGVKNVKHKIDFMANDDIVTPTKLVGKKIAPIFVSCTVIFLHE